MKRLAFDFDDVLFNTFASLLAFCNKRYQESFQAEAFTTFQMEKVWGITQEEWRLRFVAFDESEEKKHIQPMPGAQAVIAELAQSYRELHIVTARPIEIAGGTHEHIEQHFFGMFSHIHFCTKDFGATRVWQKHTVCQEKDLELIVEDNPVHALACAKAGIQTILFDQPWNRTMEANENIVRAYTWSDVAKELRSR